MFIGARRKNGIGIWNQLVLIIVKIVIQSGNILIDCMKKEENIIPYYPGPQKNLLE